MLKDYSKIDENRKKVNFFMDMFLFFYNDLTPASGVTGEEAEVHREEVVLSGV